MIRNWFRNFHVGTLVGDSAPRAARKQQNKDLSTRLAEINRRNAEFWARQPVQITDAEPIVERKKSWHK